MSATILIVDDHDLVRTSLCEWLGSVLEHCRFVEATTGEQAVQIALTEEPAIVLMDVALPRINGIEATRQIKAILPQTQIVMLSIHEESRYQFDAENAGASFYVLKRRMYEELLPILVGLVAQSKRKPSEPQGAEKSVDDRR